MTSDLDIYRTASVRTSALGTVPPPGRRTDSSVESGHIDATRIRYEPLAQPKTAVFGVNDQMPVADVLQSNVVKWLFYGVIVVAGLAAAAVILEPVIRYSYDKNESLGFGVRTDRLTGERCSYAGPVELARKLGLKPCQ